MVGHLDSVVQRRRHPQAKRTGFLLFRVDLRNGGGESEVVPGDVEVLDGDGEGDGADVVLGRVVWESRDGIGFRNFLFLHFTEPESSLTL